MFEEPHEDSWRRRFGEGPPGEAAPLARFLAHRSVRKFDGKEVPEGLVRALLGTAQSAATSSNLQLWSVVSVQDPGRRERLAELCAGQEQVRRAPWFFAFLADHARLQAATEGSPSEPDALGSAEMFTVSVVDAALAAERMVCAAESLGLATCYIGALRDDPRGVAELLALPPGVVGLFGLCLGWPHPEAGSEIKPRLHPSAVWMRERYTPSRVDEYDGRMRGFYASQRMDPSVPWSLRSGRRCQARGVGPRLEWGQILRERGFWTWEPG